MAGSVVALPLITLGLVETDEIGGQAALILIGFCAQFVAGYTAARLSPATPVASSGLAALVMYTVVATLAIAAGEQPSIFTLVFSAVAATVIGSAAGVLTQATREA